MVNYDPKNWFAILISCQGTVIPRLGPRLAVLAGAALTLWVIDLIARAAWDKGIPPLNPLSHTVMGVAVGLLIVFRNNCSYDRYWEGRKLWGGIVNQSRNLVRGATAYVGATTDLANLVAAYALALKQGLRANTDLSEVQPLVPEAVFQKVSAAANPPNAIAYFITAWIQDQRSKQKLDPLQARTLESYVATILDCQGGCERILKTPIPFAYAVHIKQLLMLYLFTLPFVIVPVMGWVAIPAAMAIAFGLLGIEEAGVEIEDPFGDDPNDLPVEAICGVIARDTMALAHLPEKAGP